jgi:hypothetical protein
VQHPSLSCYDPARRNTLDDSAMLCELEEMSPSSVFCRRALLYNPGQPQTPEFWDYRQAPPHLASGRDGTQLGQHSTPPPNFHPSLPPSPISLPASHAQSAKSQMPWSSHLHCHARKQGHCHDQMFSDENLNKLTESQQNKHLSGLHSK